MNLVTTEQHRTSSTKNIEGMATSDAHVSYTLKDEGKYEGVI